MRIKPEHEVGDLARARAHVEHHGFATIVTPGLQATHMPCLLDPAAPEGELVVLGHVAKADPAARDLGAGDLLLVFHGPHGYVSASWYGPGAELIPTWDHVTLHVRGRPEVLDDPYELLAMTVDHFEAAVEQPWSLDRMADGGRAMAREVLGFRLRAASWHLEEKLHQDKAPELRRRVVAGLEAPGPYRHPALAALVRAQAG